MGLQQDTGENSKSLNQARVATQAHKSKTEVRTLRHQVTDLLDKSCNADRYDKSIRHTELMDGVQAGA